MFHDTKEWTGFLRLPTSSANYQYGGPAWNSSSLRLSSCVLEDCFLTFPNKDWSDSNIFNNHSSLHGPSMTPQTQPISSRREKLFYLSQTHDPQWSPNPMCQFQQSPHTVHSVHFHCTAFQKEKTSLRTGATVYELVDVWWFFTGHVVSSSFWPSRLPFLDMPTRTVPATSLSFHCNCAQGTTINCWTKLWNSCKYVNLSPLPPWMNPFIEYLILFYTIILYY